MHEIANRNLKITALIVVLMVLAPGCKSDPERPDLSAEILAYEAGVLGGAGAVSGVQVTGTYSGENSQVIDGVGATVTYSVSDPTAIPEVSCLHFATEPVVAGNDVSVACMYEVQGFGGLSRQHGPDATDTRPFAINGVVAPP